MRPDMLHNWGTDRFYQNALVERLAATRPCQTLDIAGADRIGDGRENDRNSAGRVQQGRHCVGALSYDDVLPERRNQHVDLRQNACDRSTCEVLYRSTLCWRCFIRLSSRSR